MSDPMYDEIFRVMVDVVNRYGVHHTDKVTVWLCNDTQMGGVYCLVIDDNKTRPDDRYIPVLRVIDLEKATKNTGGSSFMEMADKVYAYFRHVENPTLCESDDGREYFGHKFQKDDGSE